MTELFKAPEEGQSLPTLTNEGGSLLEALVGEGKKFKDAEALARGKAESDAFIEQLKTEQARLREELNTRLNMEQLLADLKASTHQPGPEEGTPSPSAQPEGVKPLTDEQLKAKYAEFSSQEKQKEALERNVLFARDELIKAFGPSFESKVMARANELGVTREQIQAMAATAPKAFLELVGANARSTTTTDINSNVPPRSSITPSQGASGVRNYAYYQKIAKEDPRTYWSPSTQTEMHRAAQRQGESFYQ